MWGSILALCALAKCMFLKKINCKPPPLRCDHQPSVLPVNTAKMLIPRADRKKIHEYLFRGMHCHCA